MKCEDCIEWEYFEGYGYGCFCMKTMTPIDADKCEFYADKRPDVPHSWKPSKIDTQERTEEYGNIRNHGRNESEKDY